MHTFCIQFGPSLHPALTSTACMRLPLETATPDITSSASILSTSEMQMVRKDDFVLSRLNLETLYYV